MGHPLLMAARDASWSTAGSGRARNVEDGREVVAELVGPEDDAARRIEREFDGSGGIAIESVGGAPGQREVRGQRVLPQLLVHAGARDGDGERFLNLHDDAGAIEADGEVSLVVASRLVDQLFAAAGAGIGIGRT